MSELDARRQSTAPLIEVKDLVKEFPITKGVSRRITGKIRAVNGVSLNIRRGEILGLVGESGCGKTTTGRCIMRAIEPTSGEVRVSFDGGEPRDLLAMGRDELLRTRTNMRLVFQDPYASLNPRMRVAEIVKEVLVLNGTVRGRREMDERVALTLQRVGLNRDQMSLYPHAFSGGQRQRIAIARALVSEPRFVVADEPVSALDVSIQAQILNLLIRLKKEMDLTILFIAHNLAVVAHACDRIAVMYLGDIVELAGSDTLNTTPRHPYTEALLSAVPEPDPRKKRPRITLSGEIGDLSDLPPGCVFNPRCRYAKDICRQEKPALVETAEQGGDSHLAACHFARELKLEGCR
jgi:peptide/nickel transport system ATP-binding protein